MPLKLSTAGELSPGLHEQPPELILVFVDLSNLNYLTLENFSGFMVKLEVLLSFFCLEIKLVGCFPP